MELLRKRKLVTINRNKDRSHSKNGIPQGSAMSTLLSNIYLAEFDQRIFEKGLNEGFVYRRYCDDLLIICKVDQVNDLKKYLMDLINQEYKLTIQNRKTDVVDFKPSPNGQMRSYKREFVQATETFNSLPNKDINFKICSI